MKEIILNLTGGTEHDLSIEYRHLFPPAGRVGQPYIISADGTINSIIVAGWQTSQQHAKFQIWQSFGGIPLDPSPNPPFWASSNFIGNQTNVTVNPNLHVTAGLYFIFIQVVAGSGNLTKVNLVSNGNNGRNATVQHGTTWANLTIAPNFNNDTCWICSELFFTYDPVSQSGGWISPVFDSTSLAVCIADILSLVASYPAPGSATINIDAGPDGSSWPDTFPLSNPNGSVSFTGINQRYWRIRVSASTTDDVYTPAIGPLTLSFGLIGVWISPIIDTGPGTTAFCSITDLERFKYGSITLWSNGNQAQMALRGQDLYLFR